MSKSLIITGGSRGIGRACAILAGEAGWSVTLSYRSDEAAAAETARLVESAGGKAQVFQGDVAQEAEVIALFDAAEEAFGQADHFINNAGVIAPQMPLVEMSVERMRTIFDTNVLGAYIAAREAARRLKDGGAIVNLSSAAARLGSPNLFVDYAGSKGAIDTLTKGLALELAARGIRVNAVRPGIIETEIHADAGFPDRAEKLGPEQPLGRAGSAREVAEAIHWLLSDKASYVTGAILDVAGGR